MPRPKKTIRTSYVNLGLPEDLLGRIQIELYSELEGKVPHGAVPAFFEQLVRQHFHELDSRDARLKAPKNEQIAEGV